MGVERSGSDSDRMLDSRLRGCGLGRPVGHD